eukprot:jgi/Ulvmu1/2689/UM014_0145.1
MADPQERWHVLLCVTDHESAAATTTLVRRLEEATYEVKLILASGAKRFTKGQTLSQALDDESEWYAWNKVGDEVLHIELTRWADVLLLAPCSANYLAKIANGLCDDLVMSVVRAWPPAKPILIQLAMHAAMWQHPLTGEQLVPLNQQPNLYFVAASGDVIDLLDSSLDCSECHSPSTDVVVSAMQKLRNRT